ncbi:MAG: hypothetical protein ACLR6J_17760 [Parabacteroides merdae]
MNRSTGKKHSIFVRVADAASVRRDINNPGVRMGDFWHMTWGKRLPTWELSFLQANICNTCTLPAVSAAACAGEDGEADDANVNGSKGLKDVGSRQTCLSFECGCQGDSERFGPLPQWNYYENNGKKHKICH